MFRKIIWGLVVALVVAQFIRPERNESSLVSANDISKHYAIPQEVASILDRSCVDCHSNNTKYPWYYNVQPVGWWLAYHIKDGKRHFNLSEFASYKPKKALKKMEEVAESVTEHWMPLESYTMVHAEAQLSGKDSKIIADWAKTIQISIIADSSKTQLIP